MQKEDHSNLILLSTSFSKALTRHSSEDQGRHWEKVKVLCSNPNNDKDSPIFAKLLKLWPTTINENHSQ